jgi:hypothetical protein
MFEYPLSCHFPSDSFSRHPYLMVFLFTFPNTRPLGTFQVHVEARAGPGVLRVWWRQTSAGSTGPIRLSWMVHYAHLAVGRTMRLPYGTLLAQTIGDILVQLHKKESRSTLGTSSLPTIQKVDLLLHIHGTSPLFIGSINFYVSFPISALSGLRPTLNKRAISGPSHESIWLSYCTFVFHDESYHFIRLDKSGDPVGS